MKIIRRILLVICLAVFLYSAGNLAKIGYKYHKLDSDNKKLQEEVVTEVKQDSPLDRKIDFNQLKSINEDIVGWIYIPNTNIDYALLKGKTNDTYIHTNYEKKYKTEAHRQTGVLKIVMARTSFRKLTGGHYSGAAAKKQL